MHLVRIAPVLLGAAMLVSGPAMAQTAATSNTKAAATKTTTTTKTSTTTKEPVVRTAKSLECSKQADAKGLHGKPRKSFMSSCKKA